MFQVGLRKLHPMYRLAANFTDHEIHLSCKLLDLENMSHGTFSCYSSACQIMPLLPAFFLQHAFCYPCSNFPVLCARNTLRCTSLWLGAAGSTAADLSGRWALSVVFRDPRRIVRFCASRCRRRRPVLTGDELWLLDLWPLCATNSRALVQRGAPLILLPQQARNPRIVDVERCPGKHTGQDQV